MSLGQRHLHARRRIAKQLDPFPAQGFRRYYDYVMYGVGLVMPLALLPQVLSIYLHHSTAGISIVTWLLLTVFNLMWTLYGILHKDVPITVANGLISILDFAIVVGALMY